ncbi:protein kinase domain-containing protein [Actinomadura chokoriensis]|uniref:protein kinase domain-containing protein n=1 Tax=Actinomadura chokoriensis TaxID=454156 RepID=UPI0031F77F3F
MDPGFRLDGRYRMERRAGRRGPAEVWRAHDELLARRVAVALVAVPRERGALRRRLRDSARAAAALAHPGIVTTYDYGEAGGPGGESLAYVVTEYLTGESLAARLERGLPCAQEALAVCAQVADALAAVHSCGVVHGDLRAGQVFLTEDGVKILGLGVTGAAGAAGAEAARDGEPGQAEDVRAFGALLAACLPDAGAPPESGLPAELAALADRVPAGEPGERLPAAEVARALAARIAAAPVLPPADAPGGRAAPRRGVRRVRRAAVLGGAAAAVLALVLAPLVVILSTLRDAPGGVALPAPPRRSAPPPSPADDPGASPPAPAPPSRPARTARPAVPAADARARAVSALARMRRAIDTGMAAREVGRRFGIFTATQVSTLLNEVDGGEPVDLPRRVAALRSALAGRAPGDVSPERAAGLSALLAEIPVRP